MLPVNSLETILKTILSAQTKWSKSGVKQTGKMPENIPAAEPIKNVEKRLKKKKAVLELDEKEAAGLTSKNLP